MNGLLCERHDILKRLRSDRQDAVCAQSRFPQAEFKDVVAKGSAPRFGVFDENDSVFNLVEKRRLGSV